MKVKKHYENGAVVVYAQEGDWNTCLTFDSERQMQRLGECITDLARIGGTEVSIADPADPQTLPLTPPCMEGSV